ncbi:class I SAM-dependent methyltransferase [Streptomyces chartreusis]|uniref:class I SAM-dependent methyltransferase n=1 Tax=Streptomyces chartreusis TaxID=1969 RepID=UPI00381D7CB2
MTATPAPAGGAACVYCRRIAEAGNGYPVRDAAADLGSPAPRCSLHWRYTCAACHAPSHFMATAYCPDTARFYCRDCAAGVDVVDEPFWSWSYYFRYRSPWTGTPQPSLDRLEFEGGHPFTRHEPTDHVPPDAVSVETHLHRSDLTQQQRSEDLDEERIRSSWDANAEVWDSNFEADGDAHRKYSSDEPLLAMLGDVTGLDVLDLGCGNGYLSRKLARRGASVTGVELSADMLKTALRYENEANLGITYAEASATDLTAIPATSFDKIVCNHVLSSVPDLDRALAEAHRVLRPSGELVVAISHPCFSCGPRNWDLPAPDSPRPEEAAGYRVDHYFRTGAHLLDAWAGFVPVPYLHRTLSDYWRSFRAAGFDVSDFDEPGASPRGRADLPEWRVRELQRIPYSCLFHLVRPH